MRMRVMRIVMEAGLAGFTEDCVELLLQATEDRLKTVVAGHVARVRRMHTAEHVMYGGFVADRVEAAGASAGGGATVPLLQPRPDPATAAAGTARPPYHRVIRLRDLAATLTMAPHLLGEHRLLLDRMLALL
jgi:hypothetical protein